MRRFTMYALFAFLIAACGGGDSGPGDVQAGGPDAAVDDGDDDTDIPDDTPPLAACNTGDVPDPLTIAGTVENLIDEVVIEGALVQVRDSPGENKIGELITDVSGAYSFDLVTGGQPWRGSIRIEAEDHLVTLIYPTAINRNLSEIPAPVLTAAQRDLGALLAGAEVDESKGVIVLAALDCDNIGVEGVSYTFDQEVEMLYLSGDSVDPDATATDASGIAIAFNIDPGSVEVNANGGGFAHTLNVSAMANTITGTIFVP